jgi:hypothetical protein
MCSREVVFPVRYELDFEICSREIVCFRPLYALGFTQTLTEISTGNIKNIIILLRSKVRPVRGADNLTAIYDPIV